MSLRLNAFALRAIAIVMVGAILLSALAGCGTDEEEEIHQTGVLTPNSAGGEVGTIPVAFSAMKKGIGGAPAAPQVQESDIVVQVPDVSAEADETEFPTMDLLFHDDTGGQNDDDITRFSGENVSFQIVAESLSAEDTVKIYSMTDGVSLTGGSVLRTIVISEASIGASGDTVLLDIPRSAFTEGDLYLRASITPPTLPNAERTAEEGSKGEVLEITYDRTAPEIVVTSDVGTVAGGTISSVRVMAADSDSDSVWRYRVMPEGYTGSMALALRTGSTLYTEGTDIVFQDSADNGKRVFFSSIDVAGNVRYSRSEPVAGAGVDSTPEDPLEGVACSLETVPLLSLNIVSVDRDNGIVSYRVESDIPAEQDIAVLVVVLSTELGGIPQRDLRLAVVREGTQQSRLYTKEFSAGSEVLIQLLSYGGFQTLTTASKASILRFIGAEEFPRFRIHGWDDGAEVRLCF